MKLLKKVRKPLGAVLSLAMMLTLFMWNGVEAEAKIVESVTVSEVQKYDSGFLESFKLDYEVGYPESGAPSLSANSRVAVQTQQFVDDDFTDMGDYAREHSYTEWPASPEDCGFVAWGKVNGSENFIRPASGNTQSITVTFEDNAVDLNTTQTYYVYIWTNYNSETYPDAYVYEFTAGQGDDVISSTTPYTYYINMDSDSRNCKLYEDQGGTVEVPANRTLKYRDTIKCPYEGGIHIYLGEELEDTLSPIREPYTIPDGEYIYSISGDIANGFKLTLTRIAPGTTPVNPNPGDGGTPQPDNNNQNTSENTVDYTHTHNFQWIVTKQPTEKTDGCIALMCEGCGQIEATQPISYFNNVIYNVRNEIKNAPENGTVTIDNEFLRCFSDEMVEELIARPDLTVVVNFTDKGVNYSFTIPAGKAPTDGEEWYGYYYLGSVYGWTLIENVM